MKNWFSSAHSAKVVLALCLVLGMAITGAGCSKHSKSNSTVSVAGDIQLSGSIGSGYQAAAGMKPGFFAKLLTTLGISSPAYAALTDPTVDKVIAIPMDRGALSAGSMLFSRTADINADKTFYLSLANNRDWLLMLVNSSATGTGIFVGSLALNLGGADSLVNIPVTQATFTTMDLGVVSRPAASSSDAVSGVLVTAQSFSLTPGQLTTLAKTDALFKNAKNIVNNYGPVTGVYYELTTSFHLSGNYGTLTALFSDPVYTSLGASLRLKTTSTAVTMNGLCAGTAVVEFVPSDLVSNGTATFGPSTPLSSSGMTCESITVNGGTFSQTASSSGNLSATNAYGGLTYNPYGLFTVLPAQWDLKENGVIKARFDMIAANPPMTAVGRPKGYIPSFKINADGTKKIMSVDIIWYYFDSASNSYVALAPTDLMILEHIARNIEVKLSSQGSGKSCGMTIDPAVVTQVNPANPAFNCPDSWYFNDPTHPATNAGLTGTYQTSGFVYIFDFTPPMP